ncbi:MAG: hypothetical protein L3J74_13655 [Bacteroidales bacterium]|nr:hypothetical protein [Bacteroidales bacterium]
MKRSIIYSLIIFILAFAACEKTQVTDNKVDENTVDNFLTVNKKYQEVKNITKDFRTFGFKKAKLKTFKSDSTSNDTTWVDDHDTTWVDDWGTCATITDTVLEDGSWQTIIDYGEEGCDEYGELVKGKITITWTETQNSFTGTEVYENLSYGDITIDGTATYSSNWTDMNSEDFAWEGSEDLVIDFGNEQITLKGTFKEKMDNVSYSITEGNYEFTSSKGYSYSYKISKPLVYNYSCQDAWIPVEGSEEISYTEGSETTDFVVDYGDGTCDNLYTVTSDGETVEYNFEDEWTDDGGNDSDSTNVSG